MLCGDFSTRNIGNLPNIAILDALELIGCQRNQLNLPILVDKQ